MITRINYSRYRYKYVAVFVFILFLFIGCNEETHGPIEEGGSAPGQVKNVEIIPTPGGADLIYTLPADANLSYVEAVVHTPEGRTFNVISSSHRDTISIVGLATTNAQEVLLYSVSKNEVKSEPLSVIINPLTPPYIEVFRSLELAEGLGGVDVKYLNETGADLAIMIGRIIEGEFVEEDAYYSNKTDGRTLFWGYEPEEQRFGVFIRDRWDHYSDTLYADITPILEVMIDKSKFRAVQLLNDSEYNYGFYTTPENIWNGIWSEDYNNPYDGNGNDWRNGDFEGDELTQTPGAVTIDLGQVINISRIRFNHYWTYNISAPRLYEVYGLEDYDDDTLPINMGAWHNWTLLSEVENVKPSITGGTEQDDKESWEAGDTVLLTPPAEAIRYIRVKLVENWSGGLNLSFAEITVYGQPLE